MKASSTEERLEDLSVPTSVGKQREIKKTLTLVRGHDLWASSGGRQGTFLGLSGGV